MTSVIAMTFFFVLLCQIALVSAHSQMTQPQSTSPKTCRLGGEPQFGLDNCHGPCDLRPIHAKRRYANFWNPAHPAATFSRGQRVTIKYSRNNHGPGGFVRMTFVRPSQIMDRNAHARNAFHYSCWGAHPVRARPNELGKDRFGFTMTGSDGEQHGFGKGYYVTQITIPTVLPDGDYVLGWAWYGGTGGQLKSGTAPQYPNKYGYFGDYYSCSFVKVRGGAYTQTYQPKFINDMAQFSRDGCMSSTDNLGDCAREPCHRPAFFRRPRQFANGQQPPPLTPALFGGNAPSRRPPPPRPQPKVHWPSSLAACRCLAARRNCSHQLARVTGWACRAMTDAGYQSKGCKNMCCRFCYGYRSQQICWHGNVRAVCGGP